MLDDYSCRTHGSDMLLQFFPSRTFVFVGRYSDWECVVGYHQKHPFPVVLSKVVSHLGKM
jgi:hypothetical protein